jgi:periplasmic divalent cation tolerance protein
VTGAIVVSTTAGSTDQAETIAQALLDRRLAACVQLTPIASRYLWQGEIVRDDEILLLIKTRTDLFDEVAAAIRAAHSYETPEIIATSVIAGSDDYLKWLAASTGG